MPTTAGPAQPPATRVEGSAPAPLGLRARKKAATRLRISNTATALFMERGFEAVTLAEVAAAAEVSVKTIFNYFAAKEDLFYDLVPALHAELERLVRERPAGTTAPAALRADAERRWMPYADTGLRRLEDPEVRAGLRRFHACADASPALVARERLDVDRLAGRLAGVLAEEEPRATPATLRIGGALLAGARREVDRELRAALDDGVTGTTVARRIRRTAELAFGTADAGLAHLGLAPPRA